MELIVCPADVCWLQHACVPSDERWDSMVQSSVFEGSEASRVLVNTQLNRALQYTSVFYGFVKIKGNVFALEQIIVGNVYSVPVACFSL